MYLVRTGDRNHLSSALAEETPARATTTWRTLADSHGEARNPAALGTVTGQQNKEEPSRPLRGREG
jgi:hypothetical protein